MSCAGGLLRKRARSDLLAAAIFSSICALTRPNTAERLRQVVPFNLLHSQSIHVNSNKRLLVPHKADVVHAVTHRSSEESCIS